MATADRLKVTILVDDTVCPRPRGLLAEHGFAALLEVLVEGEEYRVLVDTGSTGRVLAENCRLLGVRLDSLRAVILTHAHFDHTGGLLKVLEEAGSLPVILHPDALKPQLFLGRVLEPIGLPHTISQLEARGAHIIAVRDLVEVVPSVHFLGEVKRYHPELVPGLGKAYTLTSDGRLVPHDHRDDTAVAVRVKGLGLVVVVGCGHSGIVNIVKHAKEKLGEKVYAVIGGLHMCSSSREFIDRVLDELKSGGVEKLYLGHCTGVEAIARAYEVYGENAGQICAGLTITLP